jgi:hypothetical protein
MPPLWLTIDTLPWMKRSISVISELKDAVRPIELLMMPMQFGPQSLMSLSRQAASRAR